MSGSQLRPIETQYRGYRFRSRSEARWADTHSTCNVAGAASTLRAWRSWTCALRTIQRKDHMSPQPQASTPPDALDAALEYARKGLPVFPCSPLDKKPLTPHGFKDATTDEAQIRAWW